MGNVVIEVYVCWSKVILKVVLYDLLTWPASFLPPPALSHLNEIFLFSGAEASVSSPSPTPRLWTGSCLCPPTVWTGRRSTQSTPLRSRRVKPTRQRRSSWAASVRRPQPRRWRRTSVSSVSWAGSQWGVFTSQCNYYLLYLLSIIPGEYSNYNASFTVFPHSPTRGPFKYCVVKQKEKTLWWWCGGQTL